MRYQTSVCKSMISWPTRGIVALVFSHSTVCSSRGEAATVSRSFLTQDGGEWGLRMPSHALLLGVCCLSWGRGYDEKACHFYISQKSLPKAGMTNSRFQELHVFRIVSFET
ncbi:hypothetical protein CHARACLAT_026547 [Characodon lateralis]|uniref:Secreted protein n=1 Tax=Characodon lateralis TaxID=208331 RepID=A0ABU7EWZ5_9TELE|nr:hypothetical protein [Characodon lateralis]